MTSPRTSRRLVAAALTGLLIFGTGLIPTGPASAQETGVEGAGSEEEIRTLAEGIAYADEAEHAWNDAVRLVEFRDKATPHAVDAAELDDATPLGRVALARVLSQLGERSRATTVLLKVAGSDSGISIRADACRMLEETADDDIEEDLWTLLEGALDPRLRASLAKTLWVLTKDLAAKKTLKELLNSEDLDLRIEGALSLAELDDFSEHVRAVLQRVRHEPTTRGRLADALLVQREWRDIADATPRATSDSPEGGAADPLERLIQDTLHRLKAYHVKGGDLTMQKLWEGAARGLVDAVGDPYTTFQSSEERDDWQDHLAKEYGGIGAYVGYDKDGFFIVTRPMFDGPAWKARLRAGDRVVTVDGWDTSGKELTEIVKHLRGVPDTIVEIDVVRKGWEKPRTMRMTRGKIRVPTVWPEVLPGGIGYVLVDNFARNTAEEFKAALVDFEKQGVKYLVLDLRWNSGGYLRTAQSMGDYLLPSGKLVVETAGRAGVHDPEIYVTQGSSTRWSRSVPLTVLVNGASASASEILSGCLQIHDRAEIVGLRTYGKGSVQNLYPIYTQPFAEPFADVNKNGRWDEAEPLDDRNGNGRRDANERFIDTDRNKRWSPAEPFDDLNDNKRYDCPAIKVTIAKYFVGRRKGSREIHPHREEMVVAGRREFLGGIEPDVPVDLDDMGGWRAETIADLDESDVFEKYLNKQFEANPDAMTRLVMRDTRNPNDWPEFDAFYVSLGTQLSREDIWLQLHYRGRQMASDRVGRLIVGDWAADSQLQRAIRTLMDGPGATELAGTPEYAFIRSRTFEVPPVYGDALKSARKFGTGR